MMGLSVQQLIHARRLSSRQAVDLPHARADLRVRLAVVLVRRHKDIEQVESRGVWRPKIDALGAGKC